MENMHSSLDIYVLMCVSVCLCTRAYMCARERVYVCVSHSVISAICVRVRAYMCARERVYVCVSHSVIISVHFVCSQKCRVVTHTFFRICSKINVKLVNYRPMSVT